MKQNSPIPEEIRLVPSEPTPEKLWVCSAWIESRMGQALKKAFESGEDLPADVGAIYYPHLTYTYKQGETGAYYEAGPSADFSEILYILAADSLEEAQKLMHNDPFYKMGIIYHDKWFQWEIHAPRWRSNAQDVITGDVFRAIGILPRYPAGVSPVITEVKINLITPLKLYASFSKMNNEVVQPPDEKSMTFSAATLQHLYYVSGEGGAGPLGYLWLAGPSTDFSQDLSIISASSLPMAQLVRDNDPLMRYGALEDTRYFEWYIHIPLRKASPPQKEVLKRFLQKAGVKLEDKK